MYIGITMYMYINIYIYEISKQSIKQLAEANIGHNRDNLNIAQTMTFYGLNRIKVKSLSPCRN